MTEPTQITFVAGQTGSWRIERVEACIGEGLAVAPALARVVGGPPPADAAEAWRLGGVLSHRRYTTRAEDGALRAAQAGLGRPEARRAALIPIAKTAAWWALAQDERRAIFEERSRHIAVGLDYLPAVARQLVHCRDLGGPFDFLTWFEFADSDVPAFDEMLARMRGAPEWDHVAREVDIRLVRTAA